MGEEIFQNFELEGLVEKGDQKLTKLLSQYFTNRLEDLQNMSMPIVVGIGIQNNEM
ncbi:hypothetical protein [Cytobacillus sp. BC1816]|uniref:hypothetical protein n=1 Tax=Cytobacillus sp. BC1816 TaxID=3440154 RepID=UPI003F5108AB